MRLKKFWYSLRFRYAMSAIALMLLVFTNGYVAYQSTNRAQEDAGEKLAKHHEVSEINRHIRVGLLNASTSIEAYLLEPSHNEYQQHALKVINKAMENAAKLSDYPYLNKQLLRDDKNHLYKLLTDLKYRSQILFEVRSDTTRQYPSLEVATYSMRPNVNAINDAFFLAINEIQSEGIHTSNAPQYTEVIQARYLWTQLLSNFRLYLANRMGSFDEKALQRQERSMKTMYQALQTQIKKLYELDAKGQLGFQASEALVVINRSTDNWYSGFEIVRDIHRSDRWRMDSTIMKEDIVPIIGEISSILSDVEKVIDASVTRDVEDLGALTRQQIYLFMWGGVFFLAFLLLNYWFTSRLVLRPIATVVTALRSQAAGKTSEILPLVRSYETAALFDAFREMTNRVQLRQEALEFQALHDSLTTLPNRVLLQDRMAHQIKSSQRYNSYVSLLIIDLDRFKEINDTLGHHIGDQLLIKIGQRLQSQLRTNDTVARLGGDEFAVILPDSDCLQARKMCKKLITSISEVFDIGELKLYVNMSIGIACYPDHGDDVNTLIRHADVAMYVAKQNKLGCDIYDPDKDDNSLYRLNLNSEMRVALDEDHMQLYYQPVIDLEKEKVTGVECLLRWQHPVHGWLSPEYIVELSEHTGLINPLTYWVLKKALESAEEIHKFGHKLRVAVNISAHNLKETDFVSNVRGIIDASSVDVRYLSFEITENAMMSNPLVATKMLNEFDQMGIHLAIDDFGTGFSSLAYLKQLPVSEMKIDKSFVINMEENNSDEKIVRSTIDLAHNLGMKVIAEGVENLNTYTLLSDYGADMVQGYYMSRPTNMTELLKWLEEWQVPKLNTQSLPPA